MPNYIFIIASMLITSCFSGSKKGGENERNDAAASSTQGDNVATAINPGSKYTKISTLNEFNGQASSEELSVLLSNGDLECSTGQGLKFEGSVWICGKGFVDNANSQSLAIDSSGNVGIGTTNPSSQLEVNGVIHSTSGGVKFPDDSVQLSAANHDFIILQEQQTGQEGCTSGSWITRKIDTEVTDSGSHVSLSSNEFTLAAGRYFCRYSGTGYQLDQHQVRLYNVTDAAVTSYGSMAAAENTEYTSNAAKGSAFLDLSSAKTFRVEHRCEVTNATTGFGGSPNWGGYSVNSEIFCTRFGD